MRSEKTKPQFEWKKFCLLFLAGIINAFGVTLFLAPVNLYDSGISGTSMLLGQLTPDWMSLSLFLLVLNVPLFLYGLKRQGAAFTVYSIFAVAVYSVAAWLIADVLPIDVSIASPLAGSDLLLCALFGGLISGTGSGLAIRFGGAMDGIEVMAVIFAKRLGISVGTFVMIYNVLLYIVCGIVMNSWKTVDFIVEGFDRSKAAMIITAVPEEVCAELSAVFGCGMTTMAGQGYYSGTDKTVVYVVINRYQVSKLREIVHRKDAAAYITITEVADVFSANQNA